MTTERFTNAPLNLNGKVDSIHGELTKTIENEQKDMRDNQKRVGEALR